jgi:hypothetical protein
MDAYLFTSPRGFPMRALSGLLDSADARYLEAVDLPQALRLRALN